ncbi:bifunctional ornithine lipid synthase OlsF [Psychrosphaera aestuarii]|uniref:GNAT family N-acyltransferase n=1 Tax=Psychrosphaera aestuarii TaxID=1266052 RepID=UPI001B333C46|nr:lysophospholipid acyltransferase family protein [Psychrosphaera aestuarii]
MISVESVVAEQFPAIERSNPFLKNSFLRFLRFIFHEREFQRFEASYPHLKGLDFVEQALEFFEFDYSANEREIRNIPTSGKVVAIANHPIGSLDGLVLLKLLSKVRKDVKVVANELLWAIEPLRPMLLPVNNMGGRNAKENMAAIEQHLTDGGALLIFPAGEVSRLSATGIKDGNWRSGFLRFAKKTNSDILPIHVDGKNSAFFYGLSMLAKPLSTIWLVHEMFKQHDQELRLRIGAVIKPSTYNNIPIDNKRLIKLFKKHVYALNKRRSVPEFSSRLESIAHPEMPSAVREELKQSQRLGETTDGKQIYCFQPKHTDSSSVMRELGRLREFTFRTVGEGTGKIRDFDSYDWFYDHVILWDDNQLEIVGAYRMVSLKKVFAHHSDIGLYSQTLFNLEGMPESVRLKTLELGRSFIQPKYWGKRSLDYLWQGVGAYLKNNRDIQYLMGPVTISNELPSDCKASLIRFYKMHFGGPLHWVQPKNPYILSESVGLQYEGLDVVTDFVALKAFMKSKQQTIPTLFKQYTELCDDNGTQFLGFNIDPDFADCIDGFVFIDINQMKPAKRSRYLKF